MTTLLPILITLNARPITPSLRIHESMLFVEEKGHFVFKYFLKLWFCLVKIKNILASIIYVFVMLIKSIEYTFRN